MWRPNDWENPHETGEPLNWAASKEVACHNAYEAGADAILEALKRAGKHIYTGGYAVNWEGERIIPAGASGFIIFIPDFDPSGINF